MGKASFDQETNPSLLLKLQGDNDLSAWKVFVDQYIPGLVGWAKSYGLQDHDAFDAAQIVLEKLVERIKEFQYDPKRGRFRGWLKTITHNVAVDLKRKETREKQKLQDTLFQLLQNEKAMESLKHTIEQEYESEVLREAENRAKNRVSSVVWQAYHLTYRKGFSVSDAANQLGVQRDVISVYRKRVVDTVKQEINKIDPDLNEN